MTLRVLIWRVLGILVVLGLFSQPALAQTPAPTPDGPEYIVQSGDSLWWIARQFGVSQEELMTANNLTADSLLYVGDRLVIPGLPGTRGVLGAQPVPLGENLFSLSQRYHIPAAGLARLNRLASPAQVYAGANLIVPLESEPAVLSRRAILSPGQSLTDLALLEQVNPWVIAALNGFTSTATVLPGALLALPTTDADAGVDGPGALPGAVRSLSVGDLPLLQGQTVVVGMEASEVISVTGTLSSRRLHFFADADGVWHALQGVHSLARPGLHTLVLEGTLANGQPFGFSQGVLVAEAGYPYDPVLNVPPETIDPEVTRPEDLLWNGLAAPATPERLWEGMFQLPVDEAYGQCWPSRYGNRRSYNDSPYNYFHTGLDFCGQVGHNIYSPAAGRVVFAGPMTVRGNATMIDHGHGVYSAYMHQSKIFVEAGETVTRGKLIGLVGATGRVTGPHLHWEIWAGGVQVEPMVWLRQIFP